MQDLDLIMNAMELLRSVDALNLYRKDNRGSDYLKSTYPHLLAKIEDATYEWTLLPKAVVNGPDALQQYVRFYRENIASGYHPDLPDGLTKERYFTMLEEALDILDSVILPVLQNMKEKKTLSDEDRDDMLKVVRDLGIAEPSEEYDDLGDEEEDTG